MPKIVNLPAPDSMIAALEAVKRELPQFLEMTGLIAQIRKGAYDAYIKQGFTEEQALELCSKSIML